MKRFSWATLCLLLAVGFMLFQGCDGGSSSTNCFIKGVTEPERTQGLKAPAPSGEHLLVSLDGPGVFISAEVTKQGGTNDLSFVILDIDGRNVVNISFAALRNWGLIENNPYGLVLLGSDGIKTLTIGFCTPLYFEEMLTLGVDVNEDSVEQIVANVIHGK